MANRDSCSRARYICVAARLRSLPCQHSSRTLCPVPRHRRHEELDTRTEERDLRHTRSQREELQTGRRGELEGPLKAWPPTTDQALPRWPLHYRCHVEIAGDRPRRRRKNGGAELQRSCYKQTALRRASTPHKGRRRRADKLGAGVQSETTEPSRRKGLYCDQPAGHDLTGTLTACEEKAWCDARLQVLLQGRRVREDVREVALLRPSLHGGRTILLLVVKQQRLQP